MSNEMQTVTDILPRTGKQVVFHEMTGYEEDMLTDKKLMKGGKALDKILHSCVMEIDGEKPSESEIIDLFSTDRVFLLVRIRQASYGDIIENADLLCTNRNCGAKNPIDVDMSQFPLKPAENTDTDVTYSCILPSGTKVVYRDMTGRDEAKMAKFDEAELLTVAMMLRLVSVTVDGKTLHPNDHKRWLKGLPVRERALLRKDMEANQVGLNTTITVKCVECGTEIKTRAETLQSFFFPEM